MGKILKLNGITITNPDAPSILQYDAIESKGSLLLFDGAAPTAPFVGVPETNATIFNVLRANAITLTGSTTAVDFVVAQKSSHSLFRVERTLKGGIHGIVTQAGAQDATVSGGGGAGGSLAYVLHGQSALGDYIRANPSHQFYTSIWSKTTRLGLTSSAPQSPFHFTNGVAATTNNFFHNQGGLFFPQSGVTFIGRFAIPSLDDINVANASSVPYNRFASLGFTGVNGNSPAASDRIQLGVGTFSAWNSLNFNKAPSRIIYRAYIEDLTVSGRTYAQVHALDKSLFDAAFAVGGKFYGDTYTSPSTIP